MKILIATGIFKPEIGGPATYVDKIAKEFLRLGHQVSVLTYSDQYFPELDKQLDYPVKRVIRTNKLQNYWRYYQAVKEISQQNNFDLLYCFDHFSAGLPVAMANLKLHRPLFIRVGGDFIWERYLEQSGNLVTLRQFYLQKLHLKTEAWRFKIIKWVFSKATKIIFTTEFQANIFIKNYKLKSDKLAIIKNPVENNLVINEDHQRSKEIVFIGRLINNSNLKNLITAFDKIKDKSFSLHIIGEGPLWNKLQNLILKYENVYLEHKVLDQELLERLQRAYLVVFPQLTNISPNTMLECLKLQTPFISTQEIGFNWLKDSIITFNPLDIDDMSNKISYLTDTNHYTEYCKKLSQIEYSYDYQQAADDTLKLFKERSPK